MRLAVEIAHEAVHIMRDDFISVKEEEKQNVPRLIEGTIFEINNMLLSAIRNEFSDHDVISRRSQEQIPFEYRSNQHHKSPFKWICDPFDSVSNAFSLAFVVEEIPLLGVVHYADNHRMFSATAGNGAQLNEAKIHVSGISSKNTSFISIVTPHEEPQPDIRKMQIMLSNSYPNVQISHSVQEMATKVSMGGMAACVCPGEAYYYGAAALRVIVKEAEGKVTDLSGNEIKEYDKKINGLLISNDATHGELLKLTRK